MPRNYRILRVASTAYLSSINALLARDPDLIDAPFSDQMAAYFDQGFVYGDSFSRAMAGLGNETMEVLSNAEPFQKSWARQNGIPFNESNWVRDIVCAQVETYRPEVIYIQGLTTDPSGFLPTDEFRERFPFVQMVVGYTGFPHSPEHLEGIDLVIAGIPSIRDCYLEYGVPCELAYHGFDATIPIKLKRHHTDDTRIPLSFVGSTGFGLGESHRSRYWELVELCLGTEIELWVDDRLDHSSPPIGEDQVRQIGTSLQKSVRDSPAHGAATMLMDLCRSNFGSDNPAFPLSMLFPERCRPAVFGLDMLDVLRRSKITVNRHTDSIGNDVGNMRMFEATGIGTCMLVNDGRNMRDLFEPDREVVTYKNTAELMEKANWLADHDAERRAIAVAGQKRTQRDHSVERRCEAIHEMICCLL